MNRKVSVIILASFLAIVVFIISTKLQKEMVDFVPTIKCLTVTEDVEEYSSISEFNVKVVEMPIEIVGNIRIVQNVNDIDNLYLKSKLYKGQILVYDQFDTADNLTIINGEEGKEKISIKIKEPENGTSYILKKGSHVNVYATISNEYATSDTFSDFEKQSVGSSEYGYSVFKILDNVKILGCFDENGEDIEKSSEKSIDTVLISVLPQEAYKINLIRELASFNITEL
jgi:hypothetical protein